jgi:hypothetical protein
MQSWMRTWSSGRVGQSFIHEVIVPRGARIDVKRPNVVLPEMYDSDAEKAEVLALFERYNRELITPEVDAGFARLTAERTRRNPVRVLIVLPLLRAYAEWHPIPEWELPVRIPWLRLPAERARYGAFDLGLVGLSVVGVLLLFFVGQWRLAVLTLLALAFRTALPAIAHPFPVQRYVVEIYPALFALGIIGYAQLYARLLRR